MRGDKADRANKAQFKLEHDVQHHFPKHHKLRAFLSIVTELTIAPIIAVIVQIYLYPEKGGTHIEPYAVLMMALFGLITVQLWPTYIPALLVTPFIMNRISLREEFTTMLLPVFLLCALLIGAGVGVGIITPLILIDPEGAMGWGFVGAITGAVTLSAICLIYRYVQTRSD